jgi:hypothetical protein
LDSHLGIAKIALANYERLILETMPALCRHHHADRHHWEANLASSRTELVNINKRRHDAYTELKQELMREIDVLRNEYHAEVKQQRIKEKDKQEEAKRREANMSPADRAMLHAQRSAMYRG